MGLGRLGQTLTALEIFELVKKDLERVEHEISLESVASVDAVTTISRYLQDGGGQTVTAHSGIAGLTAGGRSQRRHCSHGCGGGNDPRRNASARRCDRHRKGAPRPPVVERHLGQSHLRAGFYDWLYMRSQRHPRIPAVPRQ